MIRKHDMHSTATGVLLKILATLMPNEKSRRRLTTKCGIPARAWLILGALLAPFTADAGGYFDKEYMATRLPPGCTPREDVDTMDRPAPKPGERVYPPTLRQMDARNEITCREPSPVEDWPHPNVKRPEWPQPEIPARPQDFDLKNAQPRADDPVTSAYFRHLCQSEAGEVYYKKVTDPQPVSAINLRPRKEYIGNLQTFDMYWIEGQASYFADLPKTGWDYKGGKQYENQWATYKKGKPDPWVTEVVDGVRKSYHLTETGERYDMQEWMAFNPKRLSNPLFLERPLTPEEQKRYPGARYLRHTYDHPTSRHLVVRIDGEEVLLMAYQPDPDPMNCRRYDLSCESDYKDTHGPQRHRITPVAESQAQYGYTWREITRSPEDLRLGITGSETMVVDMRTGQVVAVRRNFIKSFVPDKPNVVVYNMERAAYSASCPGVTRRRLGAFIDIALGLRPDTGPSPR